MADSLFQSLAADNKAGADSVTGFFYWDGGLITGFWITAVLYNWGRRIRYYGEYGVGGFYWINDQNIESIKI